MKQSAQAHESVPLWEIYLARALKVVILLTAVGQFWQGDIIFGLGALLATALVSLPAYLSRDNRHPFPVEIEILLSIILVVHLTLGLALDFYNSFSHYDKLLHYGNSVLVSFIGFMVAYALYFTGRLHASPVAVVWVILLMTLGIGALWEIAEYGSDQLLYGHIDTIQKQQGSPTLDPLDDTMLDLIGNLIGGIIGAVAGGLYIRHSRRTNSRRFVEVMKALSDVSDDN
ncbi:MAG: hypothetical protein H6658_12005 [Ardenticatenaceae bacterium]|nr:hypothetical protein [Ardenticatenaceae bacterium]